MGGREGWAGGLREHIRRGSFSAELHPAGVIQTQHHGLENESHHVLPLACSGQMQHCQLSLGMDGSPSPPGPCPLPSDTGPCLAAPETKN